MTKQDVVHGLLVLGLAGLALESRLANVVSIKIFAILDVIFVGAILVAYYSDVIFAGKTPELPPQPPTV